MKRRTYLTSLAGAATIGLAGCLEGETGEGSDAETVGEWAGSTIEFAIPPFQDAPERKEEYQGVFE